MLDLNLILYLFAVFFGLALFFFYDPDDAVKSASKKESSNRHKAFSLLATLGINVNSVTGFHTICDAFSSLDDLSRALKRAGVSSCQLIVGVDFTASNEWQGRRTFGAQCLHKIVPGKIHNPYQKVISVIGQTLEPLWASTSIPAYGFGDAASMDRDVFPLKDDGSDCNGFNEVLDAYSNQAQSVRLGGPTSYAPVIRQAIEVVKEKGGYHILVIIADGQVTEEIPTISAIIAASRVALSILVVGVGDGPWTSMHEFDDRLPLRRFDNFQFVDYHGVARKGRSFDTSFALQALMEIPDQYRQIRTLGYLD